MLDMNNLKVGVTFKYKGDPYQVLKSSHLKMGRGSAVLQTKIKNLKTGVILEKNFKQSDKFDEVEIEKKPANFLYTDDNEAFFMDKDYEQFSLNKNLITEELKYLKESSPVEILFSDGSPLSIALPPKVELEVKDAPPAIRGDTAGAVTKTVTLENGTEIGAPIFIKTGDIIRINTQTGEYVERVNK